jgi:tRNA threonylcarbamoyladenosine biosynthesis protein TsaB
MRILAVDTTFGACSAAVLEGEQAIARHRVAMERGHAEALAPMVDEIMKEAGLDFAALDLLAVTTGPGTFTGQRIGLAFMRALKVALKRPLTGVTSLAAMAAQAMAETGAPAAAALHDARRGEVYLEICGPNPRPTSIEPFEKSVEILNGAGCGLALAGTAAKAVMAAMTGEATLTDILAPDAVWAGRLALALPRSDEAPHPLYLRPPDAKLPNPA